MNKIFLHFLLAFFLTAYCFSQVKADKGFIALTIGPSFPTGDFADIDKNPYQAPAKTGLFYSVLSEIPISANAKYGLVALLNGQSYPVDEDAISELNGNATVTSDSWFLAGLYAGIYGSFPISDNNYFVEIRGMVGSVYTKIPKVKISSEEVGGGGNAYSFAYIFGAGFKYNTSNSICLLFNLDYMGSSPEITNLSPGVFGPTTSKVKLNINAINLTFGAGLRF